jgi:precorrin-2/cobalt-factor-2 C20-methyltransferase
MTLGALHGIGVGPGDPELLTLKAAALLSRARLIFVPKTTDAADSLALAIARRHLRADAEIVELVFPMSRDRSTLAPRWAAAARQVAERLRSGEDACFLTLGDASLYSTWSYLRRALTQVLPEAPTVTVPGIQAISAAAAVTGLPLGEGKAPVTILPTTDDMGRVRAALEGEGTLAVMKIGPRLPELVAVLREQGALARARLVARVGLPGQQIIEDLGPLAETSQCGYLAVVLVPPPSRDTP